MCEALGVDQITQVRKIESRSWATIGQRPAVAHDGALRELTMVDLDTLGMWLATFDARCVSLGTRSQASQEALHGGGIELRPPHMLGRCWV